MDCETCHEHSGTVARMDNVIETQKLHGAKLDTILEYINKDKGSKKQSSRTAAVIAFLISTFISLTVVGLRVLAFN